MLKLNLQFFASKKGVSSTRNGRDSRAKRLELREVMDNLYLLEIS